MKNVLTIIGKIFIVGLVLAGAVIAIIGLLKPSNTRAVKINNTRYVFEKQTLANGNCYYIYQTGSKVFVIPCEENK